MGMARLNKLTARGTRNGKPRKCGTCGKEIASGDVYYWWKFRFGGRHIRCANHPPEHWERESNDKRREIMQGQDAVEAAREALTLEDAISAVEAAIAHAEAAEESFQNAVDGWQGTNLENAEIFQTFESAVSELDDFVSSAGQVLSELQDFDPEHDDDGEDRDEDDPADEWLEIANGLDDFPDPDF